jgi:hypothetical protein
MKIQTEKEQIVNAMSSLNQLLEWQNRKVERARKKLDIKQNWITSFWIWNNAYTLNFILQKERSIYNELLDYYHLLKKQLSDIVENQ